MSLPPTTFEEASVVESLGTHEYRVSIHPDFSWGSVAHGGYLFSLLSKAIALHYRTTLQKYDQPDTAAMHLELLRPAPLGEAKVMVKDSRLGKGSSTVQVALVQGGKERVVGYATNTNRLKTKGLTLPTGYSLSPAPAPISFPLLLANKDPNYIRYQIPWRPKIKNAALTNVAFAYPRTAPADKAVREQWISPALPSEVWTTPMLGLLIDHCVPPPENFFPDSPMSAQASADRSVKWAAEGMPKEHPEWSAPRFYMTVNMGIEVKKNLPAEGVKWLFTRFRVKGVRDGRVDLGCEIWDGEGELVAVSQQVWMVVEVDREMMKKTGPMGKM